MSRVALTIALGASLIVGLAACGSDADEQAQMVSVAPTAIATTPPLSVPTPTPVPSPLPTALPQITATPVPTPSVAPTTPPTPTVDPAPSATPASQSASASTDATPATATAAPTETPSSVPTPTEEPEDLEVEVDATATPTPETPTAVVAASGEPPLECFDRDVQVYRAFVDGVDALSMESGRVYCTGAGTNAVSAGRSYRHSSGLIVQRNADYIFTDDGSAYIPYSGSLHFCINGQPASTPFRADTVPALLVVIDNEAQGQLAQGASGPAAFSGSASQC